MNLDFFNNLNKKENSNLNDFVSDLHEFLTHNVSTFDNGDTFTIDRFEKNNVIIENRATGKMLTISVDKIPNNVKEGDILIFLNGEFQFNSDKTKSISDRIQNKFNKLKKK